MATRSPAAAGWSAASRRHPGPLFAVVTLFLAACAAPAASSAPTAVVTAPSASAATSPSCGTHHRRSGAPSGTVHLYASVTQNTIDVVVAAYEAVHPEVSVDVFRAPTGELAGRIAAEQRAGKIGGDVFWMTDPLSIQGYASQGLLAAWTPSQAADLDPGYVGDGVLGHPTAEHGHGQGLGPDARAGDVEGPSRPGVQGRRRHPRSGVRRLRLRGARLLHRVPRVRDGLLPGTQGEWRRPGESARRRDDRRRRGPVQGRDDARQLGANGRRQGLTRRARLADRWRRSRSTARSPS